MCKNRLPVHIKLFKDAVEWLLDCDDYKGKVTVLVELFQGSSKLFPEFSEFSGDIQVSGGVCQGMALEWIKKNNASGGMIEFRRLANSDWNPFACAQVNISHKKRILRILNNDFILQGKAFELESSKWKSESKYRKETGAWAGIKHSFVAPKTIEDFDEAISNLSVMKQSLEITGQQLAQYARDMYTQMVFATQSECQKFKKIFSNITLAQVRVAIKRDQGKHPCYYLINLNEDTGHTIAVHAAYRPRLLDANGCEFQFDCMDTLYQFMSDYWQIYKRCGFSNASVEVYRFEIRATKRNTEYFEIVERNRHAVNTMIKYFL